MTRLVTLQTLLAVCTVVTLVQCDKYLHDLKLNSQEVIIGADLSVTVSLEVNEEDTCWVAETEVGRVPFWVYEEDGTQNVDLTKPIYLHRELPVFLGTNEETMKSNINFVFQKIACGAPLVCEEDQRFLCRFSAFTDGEKDKEMCDVNVTLST